MGVAAPGRPQLVLRSGDGIAAGRLVRALRDFAGLSGVTLEDPRSVCEAVLAYNLARRGLVVERQKPVPIRLEGVSLDEAFRADLLVEGTLLIELKSVERTAPVHGKQVLTYLRLMDLPLGLLMNFGAATFKERIQRVANNRSSLRLRGFA